MNKNRNKQFMNKKQAQELKNSIRICGMKLETIRPHLKGEKPILNESYNQILIQKAILRDKLQHKEPSFFTKLMKKLNNPKKELICDYFK